MLIIDLQEVMNKGLRRSPSDAADASFRELTYADAEVLLHKELERLINTASDKNVSW